MPVPYGAYAMAAMPWAPGSAPRRAYRGGRGGGGRQRGGGGGDGAAARRPHDAGSEGGDVDASGHDSGKD